MPLLIEKLPFNLRQTQPTFQRWINVVSTLWINVEITLIRHWKWNGFSTLHNTDATSVPDVEAMLHNIETKLHNVGTTLIQRCFNLVSMLDKTILNSIGLVVIMDLQIDESFTLLNKKTFFTIYYQFNY